MHGQEARQLLTLIEAQGQVVSRAQALDGGLSRHAVAHRLRPGGPWRRLLPGVYQACTGTPTQVQREIAALLYAGPQAVITGGFALRHYRLPAPQSDRIDVLVPQRTERTSTAGVRLHRTTRLPEMVEALPYLRYALPHRAVADTARWLTSMREARAVIAGAVQHGYCTVGQLTDELNAGPVRGSALLRSVLSEVGEGIRSAPEAELRELIKRAGLPKPLFNPRLYLPNGIFLGSPDVWWAEAGVAVEVDSKRWHLSPDDWERTMDRHASFGAHAIVTLHFTPHKLRTDPASVIAAMRNAYQAGITRPRLPITALPAAA
jgi:hypothetical protein